MAGVLIGLLYVAITVFGPIAFAGLIFLAIAKIIPGGARVPWLGDDGEDDQEDLPENIDINGQKYKKDDSDDIIYYL